MTDFDKVKDAESKRHLAKAAEYIGRSIFFLSLALMILFGSYLIWSNPKFNHELSERIKIQEQQMLEAAKPKTTDWKNNLFTDVASDNDNYPIVVLKTGFKVIKAGLEKSVVGWKYEIANTSPKTTYTPSVTFTLQDSDGFDIASGSSETVIEPQSFGTIMGTINVNNSDLGRLSDSTWFIGLSPNWLENEKGTKDDRYTRLTKINKKFFPYWVGEAAKQEYMEFFANDKWQAIQKTLGVEFPKEKASEQNK